jgi:hypothetical protein
VNSSVFFCGHRITEFSRNKKGLFFTPEPINIQHSSKAKIKVMLYIAILSVKDKGLYTERQSNMEVLTLYTNIKFTVGGLNNDKM